MIRTLALACLGVWVASVIVPDGHHSLIDRIGWMRYLGVGVLVLLQVRLSIELYRGVFRGASDDARQVIQDQAERDGVPPWVAKLMAAEARLLKCLWERIRLWFR